MVASVATAPSERAFEVFHLVEIAGLSTRQAAEQVGLSQTRVIQLRDAVETWIADQPSVTDTMTKEQRLRLAEYKAHERLNHLYSLALESFRHSQGVETTRSIDKSGGVRATIRESFGRTCYLQMALRIASQQAKLPVVLLGEGSQRVAAALLADMEGPAEEPPAVPQAEELFNAGFERANPSQGDCSPATGEQTECVAEAAAVDAASDGAVDASALDAEPACDVSETEGEQKRPVHSAIESAYRPSPEPVFVDPSKLIGRPPLSRKQRRKAQRLLQNSLRRSAS